MSTSIESLLKEHRVFPPEEEFSEHAHIRSMEQYRELYAKSVQDPEGFWGEMAQALHWFAPPQQRARRGPSPTPGGSSAAPPTSRTTASIGTRVAAPQQGRDPLGGRERRHADAHVPPAPPRGVPLRQRAAQARRPRGRPRGDLHGHGPRGAVAMLACARIGAVHTVIFGGFAADAVRDRMNDAKASMLVVTCDGAWRRGRWWGSRPSSTRPPRSARRCVTPWCTSAPASPSHGARSRSLLARGRRASTPRAPPIPSTPSTRSSSSTPRAPRASPRAWSTPPAATWSATYDHDQVRLRSARERHVLLHRRRRLDHRPQLRRVRAAPNGATVVMYEGAPDFPDRGSPVADLRALGRDDLLHGADGHSRVHALGRAVAHEADLAAAIARHRRRADQPRGVDVVPARHRQRPLPGRRHVVADRDRRDHDVAAAGSDSPRNLAA
jgi:hypothetical protein